MNDHTDRMPRFVLEHLHRSGWTSFRDVQLRAFDVLFDTDDHLLISSGTSSGKTEAALIPVVSSLHSDPPDGIGALYVGPTKALIDDQFSRFDLMLRDSGIKVSGWHGDVDAFRKEAIFREPEGILQITPESLEGIIDGHPEDLRRMFGNLRFVIVDELHAFMSSDRGLQLLCELTRIERAAGCSPRRIGLSATLSEPGEAAGWLGGSTGRGVSVVSSDDRRSCRMGIKHCRFPPKDREGSRDRAVLSYYSELFRLTDPYNCIVFTNSRAAAERTARSLEKVSKARGSRNPVRVHHGSLTAETRRLAEADLKGDPRATVVATVTLELGMDIGGLDRVVQIGAPWTCSSMVQRMGRSGRRSGRQEMIMFCNDDDAIWHPGIDGVSMELARGIAEAELYLREGWTERIAPDPLPYGLLFHQTLAALKGATGDVRFTDLVRDVLSLDPFAGITVEEYRRLARHMIVQGAMVQTADRSLVIGPSAEWLAFGREFPSVFTVKKETEVRCNGTPVGTVQGEPEYGTRIGLAGRVWMVTRRGDGWVDVEETDGDPDRSWSGEAPDVDDRVVAKMRDVLLSDDDYPYLDSAARAELSTSRSAFRASGAADVFVDSDLGYSVYPWLGSVKFDTLRRMLSEIDGVQVLWAYSPVVIEVATDLPPDAILEELARIRSGGAISTLLSPEDRLRSKKFDRFVPDDLLANAFCARRLDWDFDIARGDRRWVPRIAAVHPCWMRSDSTGSPADSETRDAGRCA